MSKLVYSDADYCGMSDYLLDWDFTSCYSSQDIDFIWNDIKSAILTAIDKLVPTVAITKRHSHLPRWFNGSLRHDLKRVRTIRRMCITRPTPANLESLSQLDAYLRDSIAEAESSYVVSLINQSVMDKSNACLYAHIRSIINIPPVVSLSPQSASSYKEQANLPYSLKFSWSVNFVVFVVMGLLTKFKPRKSLKCHSLTNHEKLLLFLLSTLLSLSQCRYIMTVVWTQSLSHHLM